MNALRFSGAVLLITLYVCCGNCNQSPASASDSDTRTDTQSASEASVTTNPQSTVDAPTTTELAFQAERSARKWTDATGKYSVEERPEKGRLVENTAYIKRYRDPIYYEVAEKFRTYANKKSIQPATLAIAWVMSHPAITAPIIGARNLEQLEGSLAALDLDMDPTWRSEVSALSPEPPTATDRAEERA